MFISLKRNPKIDNNCEQIFYQWKAICVQININISVSILSD